MTSTALPLGLHGADLFVDDRGDGGSGAGERGLGIEGLGRGRARLHFPEGPGKARPVGEDFLGALALGGLEVLVDEVLEDDFVFVGEALDDDEAGVVELAKRSSRSRT